MQFGPQIPNLRSGLTSEAIWRMLWPLRPLHPPKQPRRSDLSSDLESMAQIAYTTICLFGLLRPSLDKSKKIKKEDESASTRVAGATAAATKKDTKSSFLSASLSQKGNKNFTSVTSGLNTKNET